MLVLLDLTAAFDHDNLFYIIVKMLEFVEML